jgi:hypothetical protein
MGAWAQEYSLAASTADFHLVVRSAGNEKITPVKYDRVAEMVLNRSVFAGFDDIKKNHGEGSDGGTVPTHQSTRFKLPAVGLGCCSVPGRLAVRVMVPTRTVVTALSRHSENTPSHGWNTTDISALAATNGNRQALDKSPSTLGLSLEYFN